ncbi:hypothetical protein HBN50_16915 [Halobacteriovorax sp. GB3]|nr:hypothetical protein [Halobacteriovorax sp. GB3]
MSVKTNEEHLISQLLNETYGLVEKVGPVELSSLPDYFEKRNRQINFDDKSFLINHLLLSNIDCEKISLSKASDFFHIPMNGKDLHAPRNWGVFHEITLAMKSNENKLFRLKDWDETFYSVLMNSYQLNKEPIFFVENNEVYFILIEDGDTTLVREIENILMNENELLKTAA